VALHRFREGDCLAAPSAPCAGAAWIQPGDLAAVLSRAVAVGHVLGITAGLRETDRLREVIGERHRWHAVRGHLHELNGDLSSRCGVRRGRPPGHERRRA
jgi:hypothetical protein